MAPSPTKQPARTVPPDLRMAHFLRCLELEDLQGEILPQAGQGLMGARTEAGAAESQARDVADRVEQLLRACPRETGAALRPLGQADAPRWPLTGWLAWLSRWKSGFLIAALLVGWFSHQFGPDRMIDILAFPLLGLILWNLAIFLVRLKQLSWPAAAEPDSLPESSTQVLAHFVSTQKAVLQNAWQRFTLQEKQWFAGPKASQQALWLHWAAVCLAAGVVAGMYARGLAREFHAGWESTFLEAPGVHNFLKITLGPAHALCGIPIPSEAELLQLRLPLSNPVPAIARTYAAPLIHLWAITAALSIGLTRLILIIWEWRRARTLQPANASQVRLEWLRSTLHRSTPEEISPSGSNLTPTNTKSCLVVPVFYGPENRSMEALQPLLSQAWKEPRYLQILPSVTLGDEENYLIAHPLGQQDVAVLFSLAATPERDVHGALLQEIQAQSPARLLVALDSQSFDARHQDTPEHAARKAQRVENWQRMLGPEVAIMLL